MERAGESAAAPGLRDAAVALVAAAVVGGLAAADGGTFPHSWGWASLGLAWAAAAALLLGGPARVPRAGAAMLALLAGFAGWTLLSVLWTESVPLSALEAERTLLYVIALGAFLLLGSGRGLAAGVVVAATAVGIWNLVAGGDAPVGYVNGLAVIAVIGILLALGRPALLIAVPVLGAVLVLAGSRGAWLALAAGLAATRLGRWAAVAGITAAIALGLTVGDPRPEYWRVAAAQAVGAPVLGTGAGTYERVWLRERAEFHMARDAHNLYLETLAEVGPLGLALLVAALAVPFAVRPRFPVALGAYTAFVVHAALDWHWEQAAVTVAALAAAAASLGGRGLRFPRAPAVSAVALLAGVAAFALVGNAAVARSAAAAAEGKWDASARWARLGARAAPWAAEPRVRLAEVERAREDDAAARRRLREALERDPGDPELWVALSRVVEGAERRAALERAARLNPLGAPMKG